jgi:hypothetical protein
MSISNTNVSTLCVGVCAFAGLLLNSVGTCKADSGKSDCWAVYEAALDQEQAGHLRDATGIFQSCAADSCSNPVRQSCQAKLFRLELDAPSVVPLLQDPAGAPLVDAQVTLDGIVLSARLDGRAFTIDPGLHEFVFSVDGQAIDRQRLVIVQGQRNREIRATLPTAAAKSEPQPTSAVDSARGGGLPPAAALDAASVAAAAVDAAQAPNRARTEPSSGGSVAPYLLGGGALAGLGAYLVMSHWARGDNQRLSRCSPNCQADSVTHVHTLYLAADISLGVAAAAALSSAAWFILSGSSSRSNDKAVSSHSFALTVQPKRSGALASFKGTL